MMMIYRVRLRRTKTGSEMTWEMSDGVPLDCLAQYMTEKMPDWRIVHPVIEPSS